MKATLRKKKFTPHRSQIDCAKRRIIGALSRENGAIHLSGTNDARTLWRYIWRQRDIGRTRASQYTTLCKALDELVKEGVVVFAEGHGDAVFLGLNQPILPRKSNSSQRYAHRRQSRQRHTAVA